MGLYTLQCACGHKDEYIFGMNDTDGIADCEACGESVSRRTQRVLADDIPYVQGGGGSCGSMNWEDHDEHLGVDIHSKKQHKEVMEQQGVQEYAPHADDAKHMDNIMRISKDRAKGDKSVEKDLQQETKLMHKKRQRRVSDKAWDKHAPKNSEIQSEVWHD